MSSSTGGAWSFAALGLVLAACGQSAKTTSTATPHLDDGLGARASATAPPPPKRVVDADAIERGRARSQIKSDEKVVLFPTYAKRTAEGRWQFELHGWIYEPEEGDLVRAAVLDECLDHLDDLGDTEAKATLRKRAAMFMVDNERNKSVSVAIAGKVFDLAPSAEDGHFAGTFEIDEAQARPWARNNLLDVSALTRESDPRTFATRLVLVEDEGVTLISDVDDTIKISEVTDKKRLMLRTFALPFEAVPGMGAAYTRWLGPDTHLHFVSSSPWQLFDPLSELVDASGFPPSTFHLKRIRPRDVPAAVEQLVADPLTTKPPAIRGLLDKFPKRKFILVGDSGEKDPEVYGIIARERSSQLVRIYIRDVTGETRTDERYAKAFDGIPADKWVVFKDGDSLPSTP